MAPSGPHSGPPCFTIVYAQFRPHFVQMVLGGPDLKQVVSGSDLAPSLQHPARAEVRAHVGQVNNLCSSRYADTPRGANVHKCSEFPVEEPRL